MGDDGGFSKIRTARAVHLFNARHYNAFTSSRRRRRRRVLRSQQKFLSHFRVGYKKSVLKLGPAEMPRSLLLVKIRAPHRDARRTLSTPTRRAPHFVPCARLCSTFLRSERPGSKSSPLVCFAPLSSRWALLSKVRVAICISIVVVHVGRRLRSLVQLLTL